MSTEELINELVEEEKKVSTQELMNELVEGQKKQLLKVGRRIVPTLTAEDMLQPNDYSELENNPHFRYEEGILAGLQSMQMAILATYSSLK